MKSKWPDKEAERGFKLGYRAAREMSSKYGPGRLTALLFLQALETNARPAPGRKVDSFNKFYAKGYAWALKEGK